MAAALDAAGSAGEVVVLGSPKLARALGHLGKTVTHATEVAGGEDGIAALVAATDDEPQPGWTRAVRSGGAVVLVARLSSTELARRALCAGLVDLEERRAGRLLIVSGRVWKPAPSPESRR